MVAKVVPASGGRNHADQAEDCALTVYVYRMGDGGYWLDQLPPRLVKLEFIEKVETE